jgi:predicted nucleic acid-binding protein
MTTVVDSNVIVALWDRDDNLNAAAQMALDAALNRGRLVVPAPVFAELMALPGRAESFLDAFFQDTDVGVDWASKNVSGGLRDVPSRAMLGRRRKQQGRGPGRILDDFLIGAIRCFQRFALVYPR